MSTSLGVVTLTIDPTTETAVFTGSGDIVYFKNTGAAILSKIVAVGGQFTDNSVSLPPFVLPPGVLTLPYDDDPRLSFWSVPPFPDQGFTIGFASSANSPIPPGGTTFFTDPLPFSGTGVSFSYASLEEGTKTFFTRFQNELSTPQPFNTNLNTPPTTDPQMFIDLEVVVVPSPIPEPSSSLYFLAVLPAFLRRHRKSVPH